MVSATEVRAGLHAFAWPAIPSTHLDSNRRGGAADDRDLQIRARLVPVSADVDLIHAWRELRKLELAFRPRDLSAAATRPLDRHGRSRDGLLAPDRREFALDPAGRPAHGRLRRHQLSPSHGYASDHEHHEAVSDCTVRKHLQLPQGGDDDTVA